MMVLDQVCSQDEVNMFKQYFREHYQNKYLNWAVAGETIDHRLLIDELSPEFQIILRIVRANFDNPTRVWSAYQRQTRPHKIHIDDYGSDRPGLFRYTYILGMEDVSEFKVIIWKETCHDNQKLHEFVEKWGRTKKFQKKKNRLSEEQDLEHTYDSNQQDYISDYLTLDGIYTYKTGGACLFDATQLHCTSNWVKYQRWPYRELLQIHVLTEQSLDCQST